MLRDSKYLSKIPKSYKYMEMYPKALKYMTELTVPSFKYFINKMDHRLLIICFLS